MCIYVLLTLQNQCNNYVIFGGTGCLEQELQGHNSYAGYQNHRIAGKYNR